MKLNIERLFIQIWGVTGILLIMSLIASYSMFHAKFVQEILLGYFTCLFIFSAGLFSAHWSFSKSLKAFMVTLMGGMVLRFVLIGVALFFLIRYTHFSIVFFLVTFFIFYIICQYFEIRYIHHMLSKEKKWAKSS